MDTGQDHEEDEIPMKPNPAARAAFDPAGGGEPTDPVELGGGLGGGTVSTGDLAPADPTAVEDGLAEDGLVGQQTIGPVADAEQVSGISPQPFADASEVADDVADEVFEIGDA